MDDYRPYLKNSHVVHIAKLMEEESTYEDLTKNLPDEGDVVDTPSGTGEVLHVNVLRQLVKVGITQEKGDVVITEFPLDEIKINKKRIRRNFLAYGALAVKNSHGILFESAEAGGAEIFFLCLKIFFESCMVILAAFGAAD